jgi:DNA invertase Pin-like site-specific DNA recombinase
VPSTEKQVLSYIECAASRENIKKWEHRMGTSRPETIHKVETARKLANQGKKIEEIARAMHLSTSRVRELLKGVNWNSHTRKHTKIA